MKGILAQNGYSRSHCEERGWVCRVYLVEAGCCGFAGRSVVRFLLSIAGLAPKVRKHVIRRLQDQSPLESGEDETGPFIISL